MKKAFYHLPGLFEFFELYSIFLPLFFEHREYFYEWCEIGSIYGAPGDCLWGGGRAGYGDDAPENVAALLRDYKVSARLTFSNSLLMSQHLSDRRCNELCRVFMSKDNGIIIHSDILLDYIKERYPEFYFVSSTTKVLTDFEELVKELDRDDFDYVVPDFRLNKSFKQLFGLTREQKNKVEFLCNECCDFDCNDRKNCYEAVSWLNLGAEGKEHHCVGKNGSYGYVFSNAMDNPGFIGIKDIRDIYMPNGFSNFKLEGRSLGSAMILEFLLYYMVKPECQLKVREAIYLDSMLDLF